MGRHRLREVPDQRQARHSLWSSRRLQIEGLEKPVALDRILAEALQCWRLKSLYCKPDDWVFASAKLNGAKLLNPGMLRKRHLKPAAKKAGVSGKVGWHTFRRTLASLFIAEGIDVKPVQESLPDSTSKITLHLYAQATTPSKLAAQRKLIETIIPKTQQPTLLTGLNS